MAIVKLGAMFEAVNGKVGNLTMRETKDGTVASARTSPSNPQTPAQQAARAALTKASRDWKNFDKADIVVWENYAQELMFQSSENGHKHHPNGINAYVELASKFYQINPTGTAPSTPPTSAFVGDNVTFTVTADTGKVTYTASGANAAGVTTEFLMQKLPSKNRKPMKGNYRSKGFHAFVAGTLGWDIEVPTGYYAAGYRFVKTATGQASAPVLLGEVQQVTFSIAKKAA